MTKALRSELGRPILKAMSSAAEARVGASIDALAADPGFSPIRRSPLKFLLKALSFVLGSRIPLYAIQSLADPGAAAKRIAKIPRALAESARVPPDSGFAPRMEALERLFSKRSLAPMITIMPTTAIIGQALAAAVKKLLRGLAEPAEIEEALQAVPNNATMGMNRSLWELAQGIPDRDLPLFIDESPERLAELLRERAIPAEDLRQFGDFLERYGHRCAAELDGGLPRWSESPAPVFSIVANYLRARKVGATRASLFRDKAEAAQNRVDDLVRRARSKSAFTGLAVSFCLDRARRLLGFRETPREYIGLALGLARELLAPLGRRLAEEGRLAVPEDLFFMGLPELAAGRAADYRAAVEENKKKYAAYARMRAPALILSDGTRPAGIGAPAGEGSLHGLPASSGTITGKARVLFEPAGARLEPGDVLVAPSTDPELDPAFPIRRRPRLGERRADVARRHRRARVRHPRGRRGRGRHRSPTHRHDA